MELTLTFRGRLPASQAGVSKAGATNAIRQHFSVQLEKKFREMPTFVHNSQDIAKAKLVDGRVIWDEPKGKHDLCFCDVEAFGGIYRSIVGSHSGLACHLDVEVWAREARGVLMADGDLDNRLKTLIDSLAMPRHQSQLGGMVSPRGDLTFCLLEDDSQVTRLSVRVERWDEPPNANGSLSEVQVRVRANISPFEPRVYHFGF